MKVSLAIAHKNVTVRMENAVLKLDNVSVQSAGKVGFDSNLW